MMIDNFHKIRELFKFEDEDEFYFCQIIRRRKENPNDKKGSQLINSYYFDSYEKFDKLKQTIIDECDYHNARAYINPNRRSFKKCALYMNKILADRIIAEEYRFVIKAFDTTCLKYTIEPKKTRMWIVDIDNHNDAFINRIKEVVYNCAPIGEKMVAFIPTKNGCHLITTSFNVIEFQTKIATAAQGFEKPEVKRNDHTLLFMP